MSGEHGCAQTGRFGTVNGLHGTTELITFYFEPQLDMRSAADRSHFFWLTLLTQKVNLPVKFTRHGFEDGSDFVANGVVLPMVEK